MSATDHILSVNELNRRARQLLEVHLATVWVRGEISNLATPSSGHWYFTLKDDRAQIRCAMFRGQNALLRFHPQNGMQVIARGRVSLYEGRGDYQLIVENLTVDGAGALQIAFEQLKTRLADEGLFNDEFKQELPALPRHIGVITSPTSAAIRDILSVFRRRFPGITISIFPVPVQGADAAPAIVQALQLANKRCDLDALILARGGGSLEDLWAFNEENVARAVFASEIPVVSAIGHETDFTICDFVADMRAPTPSAAAEMLSPEQSDFEALLAHYTEQLQKIMLQRIALQRNALLHLIKRLRHPAHILREQQQRLDHLEWRLLRAHQLHGRVRQQRLEKLENRLRLHHPRQAMHNLAARLERARQRLSECTGLRLERNRQRLQHAVSLLDSLSPLSTLQRGYSIARDQNGQTITNISQVQIAQNLQLQLHTGRLDCTVTRRHPPISTDS